MTRHSMRVPVRVRDLVTCNRCGAPDLVWLVSARTGKKYLAQAQRFYDRYTNAEEAVAFKAAFHDCEQYRKDQFARAHVTCPHCKQSVPNADAGQHFATCMAERTKLAQVQP